ncbi:hypothetical protein L9F63_015658, partial [Diploptera punctata]
ICPLSMVRFKEVPFYVKIQICKHNFLINQQLKLTQKKLCTDNSSVQLRRIKVWFNSRFCKIKRINTTKSLNNKLIYITSKKYSCVNFKMFTSKLVTQLTIVVIRIIRVAMLPLGIKSHSALENAV